MGGTVTKPLSKHLECVTFKNNARTVPLSEILLNNPGKKYGSYKSKKGHTNLKIEDVIGWI